MKIVYYHRVAEIDNDYNKLAVTPEIFEQHICYYKEHYNIIPIDMWDSPEDKEREKLIITFDDGYEDMYTNLLPIVEKYKVPVTVYISTGRIDGRSEMWCDDILRYILSEKSYPDAFDLIHELYGYHFDTSSIDNRVQLYRSIRYIMQRVSEDDRRSILKQLSLWSGISHEVRPNRRIMTVEQIRQLKQSSLVTIGAHTINHPSLARYGYEEQKVEIEQSKSNLEQIIEMPVLHFSYPFGTKADYDKNSIKVLKECGFHTSVTTVLETDGICAEDIPFQLPRHYVGNWSVEELARHLNGTSENNGNVRKTIEYIGSLLGDRVLFDMKYSIVIFGTGQKALHLYDELKKFGMSKRVVAYADNNQSKQNTLVNGVPVISPDKITEWDNIRVIIGSMYDKEIIPQLHEFGLDRIHLIV